MRGFRLSDAEFAALAAGRPSPATLAELRRAQLSRHLLQLRATGTVPAWYAGEHARRRLADPMTHLHTAATLAARRSPPPDHIPGPRHVTVSHGGLTLSVRLEDTDPLRSHLGLTPAPPLDDAAADAWQRTLAAAWRLLVDHHRPAAGTLAAVLSVLVPVEPDPGAGGISATTTEAYGAVAISFPQDPVALAVGLVHEIQHSLLNATHFLFALTGRTTTRGYSPWRDDPRPPLGVLHGAYAYQAVTRFWRTEYGRLAGARTSTGQPTTGQPTTGQPTTGHPTTGRPPTGRPTTGQPTAEPADRSPAGSQLAAFEFARWRAAVVAAADELLAGNALTAAGRRFAGALRAEVAGWLDEPVDAEVARLAAGANADHRARWRLRNLTVDPATVAAAVRAWHTGAAPPDLPAPQVRAAGHRELHRSARLALFHRHLRRPDTNQPDTHRPGIDQPGTGESELLRSGTHQPGTQRPDTDRPGTGESELPRSGTRRPSGPDPMPGRHPSPGGRGRPWPTTQRGADSGTGPDPYVIGAGDLAYLKGDLPAAYRAYLRAADLGDWSGLALVAPHAALRDRPELVRAVHRELPDVDLDKLAAWLSCPPEADPLR